MTQNKGSKIALAVAGLLLVAGAATAIAMTQSETNNPASLFGTETGPENSDTMTPAPDAPAAETGEAPSTVLPEDNQEVPGMKGLDGNAGDESSPLDLMPQDDSGTTGGEAAPKTE